jgi:tubulin polyglutamylase TTLL5
MEVTDSPSFRFVTVKPKRSCSEDARKLKILQGLERSAWAGVHAKAIGLPQGLRERTIKSSCVVQQEQRNRDLLRQLQRDSETSPNLVKFVAVRPEQLFTEIPTSVRHRKGQWQELLYRVFKAEALLVRSILEMRGFYCTDSHDWNLMWVGTAPPLYMFEGLNEFQRINHFPASTEITRKDRLCSNLKELEEKFGRESFDFTPKTYVLPQEFEAFEKHFAEEEGWWIIKPCCSSQGRGIYIVDALEDVPRDEALVISRYVANPLLVNGLKFDLRLYVLVPCFEPLRIYLYEEGLARFASEPYGESSKARRFAHLTNYSVNKKNSHFIQNEDSLTDDVGHKWSMSALFKHLEKTGADTELLWSRVYDLVIKTIIAAEAKVVPQVRTLGLHRSNCFDLFGFDVLIDNTLKPWLMEVNLSPSLATEAPIDLHIKSNLIADALNLVGVKTFDRRVEGVQRSKARLKTRLRVANSKRGVGLSLGKPVEKAFLRIICKEILEEHERRGHFLRLYPAKGTDFYDKYFVTRHVVNSEVYSALFDTTDDTLIEPTLETGWSTVGQLRRQPPNLRDLTESLAYIHNADLNRPQGAKDRMGLSVEQRPLLKQRTERSLNQRSQLEIRREDLMTEYVSRLLQRMKKVPSGKLHKITETRKARVTGPLKEGRGKDAMASRSPISQREEFGDKLEKLLLHLQVNKLSEASTEALLDPDTVLRLRALKDLPSSQLEGMLLTTAKTSSKDLSSYVEGSRSALEQEHRSPSTDAYIADYVDLWVNEVRRNRRKMLS